MLSISRFLIGPEPLELKVHKTASVMIAFRECSWSIYCVRNNFRGMASYFPRFSSSSRQNVVDSRGVAEGVHKQALSHSTRKLRPTPHVSFVSLSVSLEDLIKGQAKKNTLSKTWVDTNLYSRVFGGEKLVSAQLDTPALCDWLRQW